MAIHTQSSCTLSTITDVEAVYTYYYLSDSTITVNEAPKDNINPPGASSITVVSEGENYVWTLTEPELDIEDGVIQTAVGKLYYIECVQFSDGTYDWGPLMTSSTYAAAKAAYNLSSQALAQATAANNATALLGGHFIYNSTWSTTNTPYSANVVQTILKNGVDKTQVPSEWEHNIHIGSNGISLRYNEAVMAQLAANQNGNNTALRFYKPPTVSGNTTTPGALTMELTNNALKFYNPDNGTVVQAEFSNMGIQIGEDAKGHINISSNGLELYKGVDSVATFGANGARIGKNGANRLNLDSQGIKGYNADEVTFFNVDMNGGEINTIASLPLSEFTGALTVPQSYSVWQTLKTVEYTLADGSDIESLEFRGSFIFQFNNTVESSGISSVDCEVTRLGGSVRVIPDTAPTNLSSTYSNWFTFGLYAGVAHNIRVQVAYDSVTRVLSFRFVGYISDNVGATSTIWLKYEHDRPAMLTYNVTTLTPSLVFGSVSDSSGGFSQSFGEGLIASSPYQTAVGRYNIGDYNSTNAFIVGNGTDNETRSNAIAITWGGDINMSIDDTSIDTTSVDYKLYHALLDKGWT